MGIVLTVTGVNTNDQLTVASHPFVTGDGPVAIRNVGGALPTSTPQFAPVTDYWVIVVDSTHFKLATSQANALLGTAIDITAVGSGTNLIEYGIPYRRARTYGVKQQVKSVDLNAMMDSLVAIYDKLTAQAQSVFGTGSPHGDRTLTIPASAFSADVASTYNLAGYRTLSAVGRGLAYIPLPAGKRIKSVTVWYDPQGASGVTPRLLRQTISSGAQNYIWQGSTDATGSAIESQTGAALNYTMLDTEFYAFEVAIGNAANRIWGATVTYDEPPT